MARLVRLEATEPIELKPQPRSVWICACGLSSNFPFCDGSHRRTRDEPPDNPGNTREAQPGNRDSKA